ncbi:variable tail fiber protein [Yersinia enterocolitica]|nr:variable tail fiber protein [Yersinia enterocolitica]
MTARFFALLTHIGAAKLANATALGTRLEITQMAVGDGGGTLPTPNPAQTQLVNEQRRAALNTLSIDPINTSQIIAEQVIPEAEGGWWIREIGLLDKDGDLIAIANCAETYKPLMQEGSGRTQTIRVILIVSSTAAVTLKIDPSVVLATRKYVDDKAIEVKTYVDDLMEKHLAATDPHSRYAPKASPVLTGKPTAPTAAKTDNSTQLATTAHVKQSLADYAPLASPALTGTPTTPTPEVGSNTQQVASAAFVQAAISALVASSPTTLNTLKKLADALGNDPDFATNMTDALAAKMDKAKNGGDIPDVAKFLTNLGLGDAAKMTDVRALIDAVFPIGIPLPYPLADIPATTQGIVFFKMNGGSFNMTTYPKLAVKYPSGVLPDMRGNAIRGWDDGRGVDTGRALLSEQLDALQKITGSIWVAAEKTDSTFASGAFAVSTPSGTVVTSVFQTRQVQRFDLDTSLVTRSAAETRMRNIAFNYIVRAA